MHNQFVVTNRCSHFVSSFIALVNKCNCLFRISKARNYYQEALRFIAQTLDNYYSYIRSMYIRQLCNYVCCYFTNTALRQHVLMHYTTWVFVTRGWVNYQRFLITSPNYTPSSETLHMSYTRLLLDIINNIIMFLDQILNFVS